MKPSEEKNESKSYDKLEQKSGLERSEVSHQRGNKHPNPQAHRVIPGPNNHPLHRK